MTESDNDKLKRQISDEDESFYSDEVSSDPWPTAPEQFVPWNPLDTDESSAESKELEGKANVVKIPEIPPPPPPLKSNIKTIQNTQQEPNSLLGEDPAPFRNETIYFSLAPPVVVEEKTANHRPWSTIMFTLILISTMFTIMFGILNIFKALGTKDKMLEATKALAIQNNEALSKERLAEIEDLASKITLYTIGIILVGIIISVIWVILWKKAITKADDGRPILMIVLGIINMIAIIPSMIFYLLTAVFYIIAIIGSGVPRGSSILGLIIRFVIFVLIGLVLFALFWVILKLIINAFRLLTRIYAPHRPWSTIYYTASWTSFSIMAFVGLLITVIGAPQISKIIDSTSSGGVDTMSTFAKFSAAFIVGGYILFLTVGIIWLLLWRKAREDADTGEYLLLKILGIIATIVGGIYLFFAIKYALDYNKQISEIFGKIPIGGSILIKLSLGITAIVPIGIPIIVELSLIKMLINSFTKVNSDKETGMSRISFD